MLIPIINFVAAFVISAAGVQGSTLPNSGQKVDVDKFRLKTTADYVPSLALPRKNGSSATESNAADYVKTATHFVQTTLPNATFRLVGDHYVGLNGIGHVYFKQTAHSLDIDNADFNVNVSSTPSSRLQDTDVGFLSFSGGQKRLYFLIRKLILLWRNPIFSVSRNGIS
jgi:hypothetical protein